MKLLLTGGGTAGHVNPAIAIAEIFKTNQPDAQIAFAGTEHGIERRLVSQAGYPFFPIKAMGISRSLSLKNVRALYLAIRSPRDAANLLRTFQPDLVIGTGGYVSWPILSAAARLGIACAIHESNAVPGLTVRRLASHVDIVLLNFEKAAESLPKKTTTVRVGNPLRTGFAQVTRAEARKRLGVPKNVHLVLSFGGSLGAEGINTAVLQLLEKYTLGAPDVWHIHGCGIRYYESFTKTVEEKLGTLPGRIKISAYLDRMPELMAAADLLICRAGAVTISEVARAGRAAILIPSPNVAGDHQTKNAQALANEHAALLLHEKEIESKLSPLVSNLLSTPDLLRRTEVAVKNFDVPDANKRIYRELLKLMKNNQ